jgi:hypothetical protein
VWRHFEVACKHFKCDFFHPKRDYGILFAHLFCQVHFICFPNLLQITKSTLIFWYLASLPSWFYQSVMSTFPSCQVHISKATLPSTLHLVDFMNELEVAHNFTFWVVWCFIFFGLCKLSPPSFLSLLLSYFFLFLPYGFLKLDKSCFKIQNTF